MIKNFKKPIAIILAVAIAILISFIFVKSGVKSVSAHDPMFLPILVASSLVDSVNPCAFSVLLITIGFLASIGATRKKVLSIGGSYILGIFILYFLIGLGLLKAMDLFGVPHTMARIGAAILLVFGAINVIGYYFPNFPIKFKISASAHGHIAKLLNKTSLWAAFLIGVLVGLFEFPCTGGPYLMVLGLLHDSSTYLKGLLYLLLYNIIFVLPLVALLIVASDPGLSEKAEEWKKKAAGKGKVWGGLAMVILAVMIFLIS